MSGIHGSVWKFFNHLVSTQMKSTSSQSMRIEEYGPRQPSALQAQKHKPRYPLDPIDFLKNKIALIPVKSFVRFVLLWLVEIR